MKADPAKLSNANRHGSPVQAAGARTRTVLCALPALSLGFALPPTTTFLLGMVFFAGVLLLGLLFAKLAFARCMSPAVWHEPAPRLLEEEEQPEAIREVMNVRMATEAGGVQVFRGPLRVSREAAMASYERLKAAFAGRRVPVMQEDAQAGAAIMLLPGETNQAWEVKRVRPWLHWLLFLVTALTCTWAGALQQGVDLLKDPRSFPIGLPYSLGLLAILGCHELGHYYTARGWGMAVTPPYFIPVPFALGTFGAFIQLKSPPENRRGLFDVAVAGPLAGLAVAIPALLIGLRTSVVISGGTGNALSAQMAAGSSVLLNILSRISLGPLVHPGDTLQLSPLAFAGWLGLVVTALNLLPIGQLDGGHMVHAMFGRRIGEIISRVALFSLFAAAILLWHGLLFWAVLVYFIAGRGALPLNDVTPLTPNRRRLGWATFAILVMILVPFPA